MLRRIWQGIIAWFQNLFGVRKSSRSLQHNPVEPPPSLNDADYEYLFMQLLEGVEHGWNQARVNQFFVKLRDRATEAEWLEWLDRFGSRLLASPAPNRQLAVGMLRLGELRIGAIGDAAYEIGTQLLERESRQQTLNAPPETMNSPSYSNVIEYEGADALTPDDGSAGTQQVTLEQLFVMLQDDPGLVEQLAQQLQIETTDPQMIVEAIVNQANAAEQPPTAEPNEA